MPGPMASIKPPRKTTVRPSGTVRSPGGVNDRYVLKDDRLSGQSRSRQIGREREPAYFFSNWRFTVTVLRLSIPAMSRSDADGAAAPQNSTSGSFEQRSAGRPSRIRCSRCAVPDVRPAAAGRSRATSAAGSRADARGRRASRRRFRRARRPSRARSRPGRSSPVHEHHPHPARGICVRVLARRGDDARRASAARVKPASCSRPPRPR